MNYKIWEKICKTAIKNNVPKEWFIKAGLDFFNQVIDDMIGEESHLADKKGSGTIFDKLDKGYNTKVQELKEFKKRFNL